MAAKLLPQSLIPLPTAPPPRPTMPSFSLSFDFHQLAASRFPRSGLAHTAPSPLIPRSRKWTALIVRASAEEGGSVTEPEPAAEGAEETIEEAATEEEEEEEAGEVVAEEKPPRKPIIKLGDIMGILNKRAIEASEKERPVPDIRTGDVVEIKLEVPENRRRASIYKGIVMSKQNAGIHTTIRIRRIIAGIGVEIVFPVYSPNIKEIKVVSHRKVRRARLYYLRDKLPRLSTFK